MNQFVAILTILSIITHAAVGCCAHSAHHDASHTWATLHGEHKDHPAKKNDCSNDYSTSSEDSQKEEKHDCQHTQCQWLPSSSGVEISIGSPFNTDSVVYLIDSQQAVVSPSLTVASLSESPTGVPLRSHLALQILLI